MDLAYKNVSSSLGGTLFTIVATQNGTTVTITPSVTTGVYTAGTPYTVLLNLGQTYQLVNTVLTDDLTGTVITSNLPIGVFGGHAGAEIPSAADCCWDALEQQIPPTQDWGYSFASVPLATRTGGDTFRFLASQNGTVVSINGTPVATINSGQYYEQIVTTAAYITSNNPILVGQYSNSSGYDGTTSDDFEMLITPLQQFLSSYTISTPTTEFLINYINVVALNADAGSVLLDGVAIPAASFAPINTSGYSGAQVAISVGSHNVTGPNPFGLFTYGYAALDGYGYPGGMGLVAVPTPQPTATFTPTNTVTLTSTFTPTLTPTSTKTFTPTSSPTQTFTPTYTPTDTPSPTPTCVTYVWPDPYNPKTAVGNTLRISCMNAQTTVTIYTISGEKVQTLDPSTACQVPDMWGMVYCWNGRNKQGAPVATGIYLYVVEQDNQVTQRGKFLMINGP
jgi:hypothetical protein